MTILDTYVSHEYFLEKGIIKEFYPLDNKKNIKKMIDEDIIKNYRTDYRVHFIRLNPKNKCVETIFKEICKEYNIECIFHNSEERQELDKIFENLKKNKKHIIICIKGLLRRADFINNTYKQLIGTTHELYTKRPDTSVIIQGLPGRLTGYWKPILENGHKTGPYRCSINAIKQYIKSYENTSDNKVEYNTNSGYNNITKPDIIKNSLSPTQTKIYNGEVPIIIKEFDKCSPIFKKMTQNKYNIRFSEIKKVLKNNKHKNQKYETLYNYINHKDVKCVQISMPDPDKDSYKKHIIDTIKKTKNNEPFILDLKQKYKNNNIWEGFIDVKNKQVCILVWCIDKELYK